MYKTIFGLMLMSIGAAILLFLSTSEPDIDDSSVEGLTVAIAIFFTGGVCLFAIGLDEPWGKNKED